MTRRAFHEAGSGSAETRGDIVRLTGEHFAAVMRHAFAALDVQLHRLTPVDRFIHEVDIEPKSRVSTDDNLRLEYDTPNRFARTRVTLQALAGVQERHG